MTADYKLKTNKGFTLIELLVSISIFLFLTGLIMVNHSKFSGAVLLENLAYDIALSIRQAQVFGLSVKEFEPGSDEFQQGYGVYFSETTPTQYVLFADRDGDLRYDSGIPCGTLGSECIEIFTIRQGNRVLQICATRSDGFERCTPSTLDFVNVVFVRPDPDAVILTNFVGETYTAAKITIVSPKGIERDVLTRLTGQISIPAGARHP